jgi:hypothetical protein
VWGGGGWRVLLHQHPLKGVVYTLCLHFLTSHVLLTMTVWLLPPPHGIKSALATGCQCNPSYSEGRDQEDHGSKPAWGSSLRDPILNIPNTHTKKGWWSSSRCRPLVQIPAPQKKKKTLLWPRPTIFSLLSTCCATPYFLKPPHPDILSGFAPLCDSHTSAFFWGGALGPHTCWGGTLT